ncbi:hypothetical protein ACHAW6_009291 [Cyclotella cf. meneghiniana]
MTMVDACTNWTEFALIPTANSKSCAIQFETNWLCRYSRPSEVGHDNDKEFMGEEFQELFVSYDIKSKPTTVKNPTAQSLVECLHLTLGDQLCVSIYPLTTGMRILRLGHLNHYPIKLTLQSEPTHLWYGHDFQATSKSRLATPQITMQTTSHGQQHKRKSYMNPPCLHHWRQSIHHTEEIRMHQNFEIILTYRRFF